ncbi:MAG: DUF3299 domain-containing protein [Pseudomonadota bacterium]
MLRSLWLLALFALCAVAVARAELPRQIGWEDLVPEAAPLVDPFGHLTTNQRIKLEIIAAARDRKSGDSVPSWRPSFGNVSRFEKRLREQGLDVEELLAKNDDFNAAIFHRNQMVAEDINGAFIRIPGYALPLEFNDTGVTELLLVPYIGVCIHVPPPPPNQIVYVSLKRPFEADDLFTPVWITGHIAVERAEKSLTYVDGTAMIPVGYKMTAVRIEPYEKRSAGVGR